MVGDIIADSRATSPGIRTQRRWPCFVPAAANSAASSAVSVISAGNGQLNPALASLFKLNRPGDGATPTPRAISLSWTPAVLKRSTSRTWRIVVLSAGIRSPVQKPKERTLIGPAEAPLNRATSSRNRGRNHLGTPSEIKSEWWATSSRIRGRLPPESPRMLSRPTRPNYTGHLTAIPIVPCACAGRGRAPATKRVYEIELCPEDGL